MDGDSVAGQLRQWVVGLLVRTIRGMSSPEDRAEILAWLGACRAILAEETRTGDRLRRLYAATDARRAPRLAMNCVMEAVRSYRTANLPLPVKVALPVTLLGLPLLGGQGIGVAALGGAVGLPAALLLFIGTAGITSVLETFAAHPEARAELAGLLARIAADEALRRVSAKLRRAMCDAAQGPLRVPAPTGEEDLRRMLLDLDSYAFERHVMSFFAAPAFDLAWVTRKSNDMGVDGFAKRAAGGLLVVQCKRYSPGHPVGRPDIQQFKGVIEENGADEGYVVTTSRFTAEAADSAARSRRLTLIDMDGLLAWHSAAPDFSAPTPDPGGGGVA